MILGLALDCGARAIRARWNTQRAIREHLEDRLHGYTLKYSKRFEQANDNLKGWEISFSMESGGSYLDDTSVRWPDHRTKYGASSF